MPTPIRLAALALLAATPAAAEGPAQPPPKPVAAKPAVTKPAAPKPPSKPAEPKPAAPKSTLPKPAPPPPVQATFDVVQQETGLWRAIAAGDQAAVGAMLADDVIVVGRNGVRDKAELLASISACQISDTEIINPRVRPLTTDTIALAYRIRYRATCAGQPIPADLNETSVWMRWGSSWRLMMHSETIAPGQP